MSGLDVNDHISPADLDQALDVIRGDKQLRDAYTRLGSHKESCAFLLTAAREARRHRLGGDDS